MIYISAGKIRYAVILHELRDWIATFCVHWWVVSYREYVRVFIIDLYLNLLI